MNKRSPNIRHHQQKLRMRPSLLSTRSSKRAVDLRTLQELNRYIRDRGTRRGFETYQMLVFL